LLFMDYTNFALGPLRWQLAGHWNRAGGANLNSLVPSCKHATVHPPPRFLCRILVALPHIMAHVNFFLQNFCV